MNWENVYLICFGVGLVLSIVAALGGLAHFRLGHAHVHPHLHVGHAHAGAGHASVRGTTASNSHPGTVSPVNGFTLMAFLCWFGGTGYLLHHLSTLFAPIVLALSVAGGVTGAWLVLLFLTKVLLPHEHALTADETETAGALARVSSAIRPCGIGEVVFSQGGARRAAPARSEDGALIEKDSEVVVMRYERGVAYVRRWEELTGEAESLAGENGSLKRFRV
ncbi:MAG TPA: hypothetical protein VGM27_30520 [Acidobacteriaceae bacterium]